MAKENEYGAKLDKNGYAPSILPTKQGVCFLCGNYTYTERHEVFGASNRAKSKALGLWVNLCPQCHRLSPYAVHQMKYSAERLHKAAQTAAMNAYGWSNDEFRRRIGKNYID